MPAFPISPLLPLLLLCLLAGIAIGIPPSSTAAPPPPPPPPRGFYINCGAPRETTVDGTIWLTDDGFVGTGNKSSVTTTPGILPILATLRYFPDQSARKHCYVVPVTKDARYLVRTTYFYGAFDGGDRPPVFDQIIDGTRWSTVDTADSYARGLTSYYEIVVAAHAKTISVCLARNQRTTSTPPFISALEVVALDDSMYNSTDFESYALVTTARHRFGYDGQITRYPDDPFNRYWEPFTDGNPVVDSHSNVTSTDFWNLPAEAAFRKALTTSRGKTLTVRWPPATLPPATYYVALYFQDNRTPSPYSWRVFDVSLNGKTFYAGLNASAEGAMVYAPRWPLSGQTEITLAPDPNSPVGPVINAGEVLQIIPLNGRTLTRDVIAMEDLARSLNNKPSDWSGDPCLPEGHSWTGVTCSQGKLVRVLSLNLTNYGISGSLSDSIGNLTALTSIYLSGNKLSGQIPEMGTLRELLFLHLDNNQFTGTIPESLGNLWAVREIYLQNNNLHGQVPASLTRKTGIDIQIAPGNNLE